MFALLKRGVKDLFDDPVHGKLRIDRRRLGRSGNLTQNQISVVNIQLCIQQNVLKSVGTLKLAWTDFMLFIAFRHQPQPLHIDLVRSV